LCIGCFLLFRIRLFDLMNVPRSGGALLLSNHQSFLDPILVGGPLARMMSYMARASLFRNPLFGAFLRLVNVFPVRRGQADREAVRTATERLKHGELLLLFPEGTRTPDGTIQPFKGGFRMLVRRAHVPVVPVVIEGAYDVWPRSRLVPRLGVIRVAYGPPIPPEAFEGLSDEAAAGRVAREMARLLADLHRKRTAACDATHSGLE